MARQSTKLGLLLCLVGVLNGEIDEFACWPSSRPDVEELRESCCDVSRSSEKILAQSSCFTGIHTYEMCCRGSASPFASWPLRAVMLGFPGSGTTSMSWLLSSHPNISMVNRDPQGRPWAGSEMQAMNVLVKKAVHDDVRQFGRWIGRDLRFAKNLYMSDPTLILNADKTWAMSQMRRGKFVVMLREPSRWISSTICHVSCTPQRQQLRLCGVSWDRRRNATVTWRAPLKLWFRHCDIPDYVNTWELCSDHPSMSPYMSTRLRYFHQKIMHSSDRMALFSLEAISEDLPAALSALDTFLELPKGGWPKKLKLPKRNVHSKNHECQDEMMKDRDLDRVLYEERRALAGLLKRLSPSKLRIPRSWRRKLQRWSSNVTVR